jgi:hypothetical protein
VKPTPSNFRWAADIAQRLCVAEIDWIHVAGTQVLSTRFLGYRSRNKSSRIDFGPRLGSICRREYSGRRSGRNSKLLLSDRGGGGDRSRARLWLVRSVVKNQGRIVGYRVRLSRNLEPEPIFKRKTAVILEAPFQSASGLKGIVIQLPADGLARRIGRFCRFLPPWSSCAIHRKTVDSWIGRTCRSKRIFPVA